MISLPNVSATGITALSSRRLLLQPSIPAGAFDSNPWSFRLAFCCSNFGGYSIASATRIGRVETPADMIF
jgi:hypothetical protein